MTVTENEFEKATLGELDFGPPCDRRLMFNLFGRIFVVYRCDKAARWAANIECCSRQTLSCPKHRYSIIRCSQCKRRLAALKLRWRRI